MIYQEFLRAKMVAAPERGISIREAGGRAHTV